MKINNLLSAALTFGLCFIAPAAFADGNPGEMHVQISNDTGVNCQLSNQILRHGKLESSPPQGIMPGDSKFFDMEQIFFGPDIILSYQCGTGSISFEVQQDSAIFIGHTPSVKVISSNGISLVSNSQSASVFWDIRGIANISLQATPQK